MNWGMKVLQTFALPLGYGTIRICPRKLEHGQDVCGAVDGIRTRDIHLGKVALYH